MIQYIQGDICFIPIKKKELEQENIKVIEDGVVARGEATGHTHKVVGALVYLAAQAMYIKALQDFKILHNKHGMLDLPAGDFLVKRQQEWIPNGWKQVED